MYFGTVALVWLYLCSLLFKIPLVSISVLQSSVLLSMKLSDLLSLVITFKSAGIVLQSISLRGVEVKGTAVATSGMSILKQKLEIGTREFLKIEVNIFILRYLLRPIRQVID